MIIISACLCGVNCKYNGGNNLNTKALHLFQEGKAVLVCPEQMGGFHTPRQPCEILGGTGADVLDGKAKIVMYQRNSDPTEGFIKGAQEVLRVAKECGAELAILKSRSPSCGYGAIYNGYFTSTMVKGNGVAAELLERNGIRIVTEQELDKIDIQQLLKGRDI